MVWREQKAGGSCYQTDTASQKIGNLLSPAPNAQALPGESASPNQTDKASANSESYFCRLITPANLPTDYLVIVGVGGVFAALATLQVLSRQAQSVRYQTTHLKNAAIAAKISADALIASERAWILVEMGKLPPFKPDPNQVQILWIFPTIKNYGKTVARVTRIAGILKLIPEGGTLPDVPEYVPGQGFDEQIDIVLPPQAPLQPRLAITGDEFAKVQEDKLSLFIHGFIEYFDGVSKDKRRSAYIFGYVIQKGYSPAETGFYPYLIAPRAYTECT